MSTKNPYETPSSDVTAPHDGGTDQSGVLSPRGRFGRLSYLAWGTVIYVGLVIIVAALAAMGLINPRGDSVDAVQLAISLPAAVIAILFGIRRLHDINGSGWWMLLSLVPIVNIGLGLVLLLKAGTLGPNRFGPPRDTPTWERVVGIIGAVLLGLSIVGVIVAIVLGATMYAAQTGSLPTGS